MLPSERQKRYKILFDIRQDCELIREIEAISHAASQNSMDYDDHIHKAASNLRIRPDMGLEMMTVSDDILIRGTVAGTLDEQRRIAESRFEKMLEDKYESMNDEEFATIVHCKKCGSGDVRWEDKQTRSADEGASVFCTCNKCHNRWVVR